MEIRKKIIYRNGAQWAEVEIKFDEKKTLSVSASYGEVVKPATARRMAVDYWIDFFESNPKEIYEMNQRCGRRITSARGAARYVVSTDGVYHGLDAKERDGAVFITSGGGQCGDTLENEFAGVIPARLFEIWREYHLNDMHPDCEHQRELTRARAEEMDYEALMRLAEYKNCPVCGYKYGSAWTRIEVPDEAVKFLYELKGE